MTNDCRIISALVLGLFFGIPFVQANPHQDAQVLPSQTSVVIQLDFEALQKSEVIARSSP